MLWDSDLVPWLCWIFPIIGALFPLLPVKAKKFKYLAVVLFSFLAWVMALFMLPDLFNYNYSDRQVFWFLLPNGGQISIGMLVDPLSIILVNIVTLLSLLILVYSLKYVENDGGADRYWFLMSLFVGGMLLLVLADNFIVFFVGWKLVGLCSFVLIGYHYNDEKDHWIGGPYPFPFQKPSRCGLKALLVTTFGDVALLAAIIILYVYAGTFNFMELYTTAEVWLAEMSQNQGILTLVIALFLAGPIAKSAQFPLHEWLPEAMSGPTPVSALIHAATMVKAGVYLVARVLPIFFFAYWIASPNYPEALMFFMAVAAVGALTAVLGATQAVVSLELKKVLAYSTMSIIGYMMLALGVSGLSPNTLVEGVSSGVFYLINHGIFKAGLFLTAGIVIHASGSIYMSEMGLSRRSMRFTWLFMWILALSLIGVPPLSGFWSKDGVLLTCWESGQLLLFIVAAATIIVTSLYVVRFMGMVFHSKGTVTETKQLHGKEAAALMLVPCGILATMTVITGIAGPWISGFLHDVFEKYFTQSLGLVVEKVGNTAVGASQEMLVIEIFIAVSSVSMIIIGGVPAYRTYIAHKSSPEDLIKRHTSLQVMHRFLWNRWYIDAFYNKIFVDTALSMRVPLVKHVEDNLDRALNVGVPHIFAVASSGLKKIQTGIISINMGYFIMFIVAMLLILLLLGVV